MASTLDAWKDGAGSYIATSSDSFNSSSKPLFSETRISTNRGK